MKQVIFPDGWGDHPVIPLAQLAKEILVEHPQLLFFGHGYDQLQHVQATLRTFWERFKHVWPGHEVYSLHGARLGQCIPCRIHADEGTSFRQSGIYQQSWGPILKSGSASSAHCFFYSCALAEAYKEFHAGFAAGNKTLDSITGHFVAEANDCFYNGVRGLTGQWYLVFLRLEGDLPAQAKLMHSARNFTNAPNQMCPWCLADDRDVPFGDHRNCAGWRATTSSEKPWASPSPLHLLPGGNMEQFMAKDLFHTTHVGVTRTFVASAICYLVHVGHFTPPHGAGVSVPARLKVAYSSFREHCQLVQHEMPDVKTFSRENLGWLSLAKMPETSWKGSDARLLVKWLIDYLLRPFNRDEVMEYMLTALVALDDFLRLCYEKSDRVWLDAAQCALARRLLQDFFTNYVGAAKTCHRRGQLFFNVTPKLHYLFHLEEDLAWSQSQSVWALNPACFATQMDEDYIGVVSQMSRHCHPLGAAKRTAERWLVYAWRKWQRK
ncbi:unnamed protein product [Symbiodinium natans]|uniref:Uncharacterized protein n=1 Tax=Symbiodinium natans TaxID=878477 RepID=A0A812SNV4_9DINO|nr:unnamed protein product [Symbiodinium natans]